MFLDLLLTQTTRASRSRNLFGKGFLLTAGLLCLCITPTRAFFGNLSIISIPEFPAEGGNVTLSVQNVTGSIREINWYRGLATDGNTRIFSYFPGTGRVQRNGVEYTHRESGFPNGSLLISGVRLSDIRPYTVLILVRPKGTLKGTIDLELARSGTTRPTTTPPTTDMPAIKEQTKVPLMLGWIVAGVVVGVLLSGALGAVLVYRFVLLKAESDTGVAGKLDPKMKMPPLPKHASSGNLPQVGLKLHGLTAQGGIDLLRDQEVILQLDKCFLLPNTSAPQGNDPFQNHGMQVINVLYFRPALPSADGIHNPFSARP